MYILQHDCVCDLIKKKLDPKELKRLLCIVVYTYAFYYLAPLHRLHCDVTLDAVHFWGQERGSPVG